MSQLRAGRACKSQRVRSADTHYKTKLANISCRLGASLEIVLDHGTTQGSFSLSLSSNIKAAETLQPQAYTGSPVLELLGEARDLNVRCGTTRNDNAEHSERSVMMQYGKV